MLHEIADRDERDLYRLAHAVSRRVSASQRASPQLGSYSGVEMTRVPMAGADPLDQLRLGRTPIEPVGAARFEATAFHRLKGRRRRPWDRHQTSLPRPVEAWYRAEQPPGVRVLRIAEEPPLGRLLDHSPRVHHAYALRQVGDDPHVVGDQDDRRPVIALKPLHELEDLCLDRHVEGGRRLVGDQQRRVAREGHRDHDALSHSPRELVRVLVDASGRIRNAHLLEQVDGAGARDGARHALVRLDLLRDLPADRVDGRQGGHRILEDHRDLAAPDRSDLVLRQRHEIAAAIEHLAVHDRVRVTDQPHHRHHRDGLPRSRFADDPEHLSRRDRERKVVDGLHEAVLGLEGDAQVAHLEQWRSGVRQHAPAGRATSTGGR